MSAHPPGGSLRMSAGGSNTHWRVWCGMPGALVTTPLIISKVSLAHHAVLFSQLPCQRILSVFDVMGRRS